MEGRLDIDAVLGALEARGADRCPICGETDTATAIAPTFIPVAGVVPIGSSDPSPPEGIEAIRMHAVLELIGNPRG
jgi:hypothetical protein